MIKAAIEYLSNLAKAPIIDINGEKFNVKLDNNLKAVKAIEDEAKTIKPIQATTLTAITDYIRQNPDIIKDMDKTFIHIESYKKVSLYHNPAGYYNERQNYVNAIYDGPDIRLDSYQELEPFLIMLNSCFIENEDLNKLIQIVSSIVSNDIKETFDNGITQTVKVKSGIDLMKELKLPRLVELKPYRTFNEAEQPEGMFYLRVRKKYDGIEYAIFEADGGAWKNNAMYNIREYLELNGIKNMIIS